MGKTTSKDQPLTDMQQAFVANYLLTLSAAKAARAAGYSKESAGKQGWLLLEHPVISRELRKAMARRAKRLEITADNVLREISKIAFSDIRAVASFDANGVHVRNSKEMHSDAAAAIQSVEEHSTSGRDSSSTTVKVKLHDKLKALEMAGRHLGLWKDGPIEDESDRAKVVITLPANGREAKETK